MGLNFKRKVGDSSSINCSFSDIKLIPFIIGIILIIVGLVEMLVLFFIPYNKIKENKKKYPDQSFEKPKVAIVAIHFTLHSLIIIFGIILILISLEIDLWNDIFWIIIFPVLIFIFWIVEMCVCFIQTKYPKSEMKTENISKILNRDPPSNLIFIYTSDVIKKTTCSSSGKKRRCSTNSYHCYSKTGISIPIKSKFVSNSYNFLNSPNLFYINVKQNINMSNSLINYYNRVLNGVNSCDRKDKEIEFHPIITGDFIISNKKVPVCLSKQTRIASIVFGVGVYYELYSKSVPHINVIQKFDADVIDSNFDYLNLWTYDSCQKYGQCSTSNKKPSP